MPRFDHVALAYLRRVGASLTRAFSRPSIAVAVADGWISAPHARLFWFIQTYRDADRLARTLADLRRLYPESMAFVVSDGDGNPRIGSLCDEYNAAFQLRDRLMTVEHGGEAVQAMLLAFLRTDADVLVKIDPDTHLRRRFSIVPTREHMGVYGTVQTAHDGPASLTSIQGGCIIVPRATANALAASLLLTSARLKPPALEWVVSRESRARAERGLNSHDWTIGWACRLLGIPMVDHPEVFSRHRPSLIDTITDRSAAVSHPRFEIQHIWNSDFYFRGLRTALRAAFVSDRDEQVDTR